MSYPQVCIAHYKYMIYYIRVGLLSRNNKTTMNYIIAFELGIIVWGVFQIIKDLKSIK